MNDAAMVRRAERVENLHADLRHAPLGHRPLLDERRQRRALDQLHDDEGRPVSLVDVVDRADARMVQRRGKARFAPEALERIVIGEQLRRKKLERHFTAEQQILGAINDTHAPAAELAQHAIVRDRPPEHCESSTDGSLAGRSQSGLPPSWRVILPTSAATRCRRRRAIGSSTNSGDLVIGEFGDWDLHVGIG